MKKDIKGWEGLPIKLDDTEYLLAHHALRSPLMARKTIWAYVVNDQPVPQELKPLLFSILSSDYVGKNKQLTKQYWDIVTHEIYSLMKSSGVSAVSAIETIAKKYNLTEKTVNQEYYSPKRLHIRSERTSKLPNPPVSVINLPKK